MSPTPRLAVYPRCSAAAAFAAIIVIATSCGCRVETQRDVPAQETGGAVRSADASGGTPVRDWSDVRKELASASFEVLVTTGHSDDWSAARVKQLVLSAKPVSELEYRQFAIPAHQVVGGRAIAKDGSIFTWTLHPGDIGWIRAPDGSTYYLVLSNAGLSAPQLRPGQAAQGASVRRQAAGDRQGGERGQSGSVSTLQD